MPRKAPAWVAPEKHRPPARTTYPRGHTCGDGAYSQLLFWRPVPGFAPSPEAYRPAIALVELGRDRLHRLQDAGLLRADVPVEQVERDWIILLSGVVSQQLSNAPQQAFGDGRYTAAVPELVAMFAGHYSVRTPRPKTGSRRPNR